MNKTFFLAEEMYNDKNQNVLDFIKNSGYDKNDIKLFIEKYNAEIPAYREYTDPDIKPI